jgi:catechol 2,3-dioxygenase-like lactoylglutathione lyase family enzyme
MPARGIQHLDLTVADVERSLAFYRELLGPLGLEEAARYPSYRGTEEVVYLSFGEQWLGLRPADGGKHRYYEVGMTSRPTTRSSSSTPTGSGSRSSASLGRSGSWG